jgi:hypothetical protein
MKRVALAVFSVLLCAMGLTDPHAAFSAREVAQTTFPPGAVVGLQGTVHLWIADQNGVLHWGGDTRALQGQTIDWNTRIDVSLDTLRTLQIGDPLLSAGLLQDGIPIYLVKWETTDTVPRLLHIQCIHDVELFGINGSNYGKFVLNRTQWEARFGIPVSTLQTGELPTTDPQCSSGPTATPTTTAQHPVIPLAPTALANLDSTLRANGLTQASINAARPTTFAVGSAGPILQAAPFTTTPNTSFNDLSKPGANAPVGVLVLNRSAPVGNLTLAPDAYLVKVRAGQMVFVNTAGQEQQSGQAPDLRHLKGVLPSPSTTMTYRDVCYSWAQVQVCSQVQTAETLNDSEQSQLQDSIGAARDALSQSGIISEDVNVSAAIQEAEGVTAVNQQHGNVIAAPAQNLANRTHNGPPPNGSLVGVLVVTDIAVDLPGHPPVPSGQYAVRATASNAQVQLVPADGRPPIVAPSNSMEVRGPRGAAEAAARSDESLAIVANLCFGGDDGDTPLCLLFEPR